MGDAAVGFEGDHVAGRTPQDVDVGGERAADHRKAGLATEPPDEARLGKQRSCEPVGHRIHLHPSAAAYFSILLIETLLGERRALGPPRYDEEEIEDDRGGQIE